MSILGTIATIALLGGLSLKKDKNGRSVVGDQADYWKNVKLGQNPNDVLWARKTIDKASKSRK